MRLTELTSCRGAGKSGRDRATWTQLLAAVLLSYRLCCLLEVRFAPPFYGMDVRQKGIGLSARHTVLALNVIECNFQRRSLATFVSNDVPTTTRMQKKLDLFPVLYSLGNRTKCIRNSLRPNCVASIWRRFPLPRLHHPHAIPAPAKRQMRF